MFWKKAKEKSKQEDKTPGFLRPLYPYRAVGSALDVTRLDDPSVIQMNWVLYELKCPNPSCVLCIHTQGVNVKSTYEKVRDDCGCPACKLQFGEKDKTGYTFKDGEIVRPVPKNDGRWEGFTVRRVIPVSEEVFESYGQKLYQKSKDALTRSETDAIAEAYYASGEWVSADLAAQEKAKAHHELMRRKREEVLAELKEKDDVPAAQALQKHVEGTSGTEAEQ